MLRAVIAAVLAAGVVGCSPGAGQGARGDPLCAALHDVRAAGLSASMAGFARVSGEEAHTHNADEHRRRAEEAIEAFAAEMPDDLAEHTGRVSAALSGFVAMVNDPGRAPGILAERFGEGPEAQEELHDSIRRVNGVTTERCGEPFVDEGAF